MLATTTTITITDDVVDYVSFQQHLSQLWLQGACSGAESRHFYIKPLLDCRLLRRREDKTSFFVSNYAPLSFESSVVWFIQSVWSWAGGLGIEGEPINDGGASNQAVFLWSSSSPVPDMAMKVWLMIKVGSKDSWNIWISNDWLTEYPT